MLSYKNKRIKKISFYEKIYSIVRQIPSGQVTTYGQIAAIVDKCTARMVGYAMANLPFDTDVPWHRVINCKGEISIRANGRPSEEQLLLLKAEGVAFNKQGCVDFEKVRWSGEGFGD